MFELSAETSERVGVVLAWSSGDRRMSDVLDPRSVRVSGKRRPSRSTLPSVRDAGSVVYWIAVEQKKQVNGNVF